MKASEIQVRELNDGHTLVLDRDIENVLNKCCECGAFHVMRIQRSEDGTIRMTWNRIEADTDFEDPRDAVIEPAEEVEQ